MSLLTVFIMLFIIYVPHIGMYLVKRFYRGDKSTYVWRPRILLLLSGLLYFVARLLPEPHFTSESTTLAQHFIGGGFVSALYYFYIVNELKIKVPFLLQVVVLYAVVSSLGTTNELLEFASTKLHLYIVDGSDVWWDLLANTLGAFSLFLIVKGYLALRRTH